MKVGSGGEKFKGWPKLSINPLKDSRRGYVNLENNKLLIERTNSND